MHALTSLPSTELKRCRPLWCCRVAKKLPRYVIVLDWLICLYPQTLVLRAQAKFTTCWLRGALWFGMLTFLVFHLAGDGRQRGRASGHAIGALFLKSKVCLSCSLVLSFLCFHAGSEGPKSNWRWCPCFMDRHTIIHSNFQIQTLQYLILLLWIVQRDLFFSDSGMPGVVCF